MWACLCISLSLCVCICYCLSKPHNVKLIHLHTLCLFENDFRLITPHDKISYAAFGWNFMSFEQSAHFMTNEKVHIINVLIFSFQFSLQSQCTAIPRNASFFIISFHGKHVQKSWNYEYRVHSTFNIRSAKMRIFIR